MAQEEAIESVGRDAVPAENSTESAFPLPDAEAVQDLLAGLLGRGVVVRDVEPQPLITLALRTVAAYVKDDGSLAVLCICDLSLACHAGAALSLIPAPAALASIRRTLIDEYIEDNLREVMNVAASWFNREGSPHVKLRAVHVPKEPLPDDVNSLLAEPAARLDLGVDVDGYGSGTLTLVTAPVS